MAENLGRLPDYTCAQTTQRTRRHNPSRPFQPVDTVRLEVALVEGKELFGWPGDSKIAEPDLSQLIGSGGMMSNGSFALLAKGVFLSPATTFTFRGNAKLNGMAALRFDYKVPADASSYHLRVDSSDAVVAYHGSFWADPESLDLERLEMTADNIPDELGVSSTRDSMDYARVKIGSSDFLLPKTSELTIAAQSGLEDRNRTEFHDCRQYAGESVLSFLDPEQIKPAAAAPAPPVESALPPDFQADIVLQSPITSSSAVGDPVRAQLAHRIAVGRKVIFSKGAILSGHISQLHRDEGWYHVAIALDDITADRKHAGLSTRRNTLFLNGGIREWFPGSPLQRGFLEHSAPSAGQIAVPAERPLNLKAGFRFTLRSRLLQSGK